MFQSSNFYAVFPKINLIDHFLALFLVLIYFFLFASVIILMKKVLHWLLSPFERDQNSHLITIYIDGSRTV